MEPQKLGDYLKQDQSRLFLTPTIDRNYAATSPAVIPSTPPMQVADRRVFQGATPPPSEKFTNPATGKMYTPEEMLRKINGDIPQYAGDILSKPAPSAEQAASDAARLNNARNDIATGETDPYRVASESGIPYSPAQLRAIEKAYAGIYDPAIDTAQERLSQARKGGSGSGSGSDAEDFFTNTQLITAAVNGGIELEELKALDQDIIAFLYRNPKSATGAKLPVNQVFMQAIADVEEGKMSYDKVADNITNSNLPEKVKQYYIEKLPLEMKTKQGYLERVWSAITGQ